MDTFILYFTILSRKYTLKIVFQKSIHFLLKDLLIFYSVSLNSFIQRTEFKKKSFSKNSLEKNSWHEPMKKIIVEIFDYPNFFVKRDYLFVLHLNFISESVTTV